MTEQEILEYNKRCAKFLGWKNLNDDSFPEYVNPLGDFYQLKELKFHSDWNWIMDVVEAIENKLNDSFNVDIVNKNQCEIVRNGEEFICGAGFDTINHRKKEAVVEAINQFLIWYEQNK